MSSDNYEKLRELLQANKSWPMVYLFKFIVPNDNDRVNKVTALLPQEGEKSFKHTKNLKYVSISCKVLMESVESIIDVNKKVAEVEGVIML